jgi:hypothetical protein
VATYSPAADAAGVEVEGAPAAVAWAAAVRAEWAAAPGPVAWGVAAWPAPVVVEEPQP